MEDTLGELNSDANLIRFVPYWRGNSTSYRVIYFELTSCENSNKDEGEEYPGYQRFFSRATGIFVSSAAG